MSMVTFFRCLVIIKKYNYNDILQWSSCHDWHTNVPAEHPGICRTSVVLYNTGGPALAVTLRSFPGQIEGHWVWHLCSWVRMWLEVQQSVDQTCSCEHLVALLIPLPFRVNTLVIRHSSLTLMITIMKYKCSKKFWLAWAAASAARGSPVWLIGCKPTRPSVSFWSTFADRLLKSPE